MSCPLILLAYNIVLIELKALLRCWIILLQPSQMFLMQLCKCTDGLGSIIIVLPPSLLSGSCVHWMNHSHQYIIAEACKVLYLKWSYVLHCNVQKVEDHMSMYFSTLMYIIYNNSKVETHETLCVTIYAIPWVWIVFFLSWRSLLLTSLY